MRKILITIMILLFTATVTSKAEIQNSQTANNKGTTGKYGALFGENGSSNNSEGDSDSGGLFRAPADTPGGRPGNGEGIGQDAPVGDGLLELTACCVVLVIVKTLKRNFPTKNR